jgi:hypothetical protein
MITEGTVSNINKIIINSYEHNFTSTQSIEQQHFSPLLLIRRTPGRAKAAVYLLPLFQSQSYLTSRCYYPELP